MSDMQSAGVPQAAPSLTQLQRVTSIFSAPSKTFLEIRDGKRSWWLPFILMLIFGYLLFAAVATKVGMQQVTENQIRMNPAQAERMEQVPAEQRATSMKIATTITTAIFLANPLFLLGGIALFSLGLMATINFGFGGKAKFGSVFAMWMYAGLPGLVKVILGILVLFAGTAPESFNIKNYAPTNIGAFLNPADTNKVLYALASSLDVVTIWSMIVLAIGIATVAGVKRGSGYIAVFGWWIVFVLCQVGIAAVMG